MSTTFGTCGSRWSGVGALLVFAAACSRPAELRVCSALGVPPYRFPVLRASRSVPRSRSIRSPQKHHTQGCCKNGTFLYLPTRSREVRSWNGPNSSGEATLPLRNECPDLTPCTNPSQVPHNAKAITVVSSESQARQKALQILTPRAFHKTLDVASGGRRCDFLVRYRARMGT